MFKEHGSREDVPCPPQVHYDSFAKKYDEWISWDDKERFGEMCYSSESEYSSSGSEGGGED